MLRPISARCIVCRVNSIDTSLMYGRSTDAPHVRKIASAPIADFFLPFLSTFNCRFVNLSPRFIPEHRRSALSHSHTLPITPVPFPTPPPSLRPSASARPVSFQNKAHISYQPHQPIASSLPNPYNSFHLQRVCVSVRYSSLCRAVANLFEISLFTLVRRMLS